MRQKKVSNNKPEERNKVKEKIQLNVTATKTQSKPRRQRLRTNNDPQTNETRENYDEHDDDDG